ncbi:uncharacterized protein N7496_006715 [Penicillium cataractarum]|uniref:Uncharacterized protein n=1 Tax=Penicillium cataractarum TaxID=2100454 RepID=A0A9W9S212_9EURO|nr:uncharacterized protein N7496_006715 [Penicillium cataractarum]KAJ5370623.1 hypothetical protein N7496_006715 [Penicillium cataractarum]
MFKGSAVELAPSIGAVTLFTNTVGSDRIVAANRFRGGKVEAPSRLEVGGRRYDHQVLHVDTLAQWLC